MVRGSAIAALFCFAFCGVTGLGLAGNVALAQFSIPVVKPSPESLFRNQCATCHTLNPAEPQRQGPTLAGVIGRPAGSVPGFKYSPGFATAGFTWDSTHLDAWLTNPQAVIPGAIMPYRQANPEIRHAIILYLEQQKP
jgi:cytochrome c